MDNRRILQARNMDPDQLGSLLRDMAKAVTSLKVEIHPDSKVCMLKVEFLLREGDLARLDPILVSGQLQAPLKHCEARIYGSDTSCYICGLRWDTNDPSPPPCARGRNRLPSDL